MPAGNALRGYTLFMAGTLAAAALFFFGLKMLFGIEHVLFFTFTLGQVHFAMAYLWSVRLYRQMERKIALRNLLAWALASALFFMGVFAFEFIPFSAAVLFAVLIAVLHNFRDYEFFFRHMRSHGTDQRRTFALTGALSALYLLFFFGILIAAPAQSEQMFGILLPLWASWGFFAATTVLLVSSLVALARQGKLAVVARATRALSSRGNVVALVAPVPLVGLLAHVSALELFYFFASWHYMMWFGFTGINIARQAAIPSMVTSSGVRQGRCTPEAMVRFWQKDTTTFALLTASLYALVILIFFGGRALGLFLPLRLAAYQSFWWGVGGFVFFSVTHILFTALPRPRR